MKTLPAALTPDILQALPSNVEIYLVGGAVRDVLLNRSTHDLDFVVKGDGRRVAAAVADALKAAYYPLDDDHRTGRVVHGQPGSRIILDFAALRGPDLETDLRARDFTINAIAMQVRAPWGLVDPLKGGVDLHGRRLAACSPHSFREDPLRVIRAVRFANGLKLRMPEETKTALRAAVPLLDQISAERVRDELFRILGGKRPASAFRALDVLGVLEHVMPELLSMRDLPQSPPHTADVWTHTLRTLEKLDILLAVLGPVHDPALGGDFTLGLASRQIGRYRSEIDKHLQAEVVPDRPLRPLLFLAALYHDSGKPDMIQHESDGRVGFPGHAARSAELARARAGALRLSNQEAARLERIVLHHGRPRALARSARAATEPSNEVMGSGLTRRQLFRFFRDTGNAGVDCCLLSLADVMATYGPGLPQKRWLTQLDVTRGLLDAWWTERETVVDPAPLLDGRQIMSRFGLAQGPVIGNLLEKLKEEQASGNITSLEQAWSALGGWLNGEKEDGAGSPNAGSG